MTGLEYVNCDLCRKNKYTNLFKARDYRFGRKEEYSVVKCNNCGLIYINPRPTAESMLRFYEEDYTPVDNLQILPKLETKRWKTSLRKFWHRINGQYIDEIVSKAEGKVLDVGCGNGHLLLPLKHKGCEVYGVETNPKSVNVCNELGLKVFYGTLEKAEFPDEFFDMVVMSQVLEHLPSPKASLRETFRILKPEGKVFIYCPNAGSYLRKIFGKYWHGWHIPFHLFAFTQQTIKKLAESAGFKIENVFTVTPDNFFMVSLKSYLYGLNRTERDCRPDYRPIDKGNFFNSLVFRVFISAGLRILDFITPNKGDCLKVKLVKR